MIRFNKETEDTIRDSNGLCIKCEPGRGKVWKVLMKNSFILNVNPQDVKIKMRDLDILSQNNVIQF